MGWAKTPFFKATFKTLQFVPSSSELAAAKRMYDESGYRQGLDDLEEAGENLRAITKSHDSLEESIKEIDAKLAIQDKVTRWNRKHPDFGLQHHMSTQDHLRTTAKRDLTRYLHDVTSGYHPGNRWERFAKQRISWDRLSGTTSDIFGLTKE